MASEAPGQPGFLGAAPVAYRIDSDKVLRKGSDGFPSSSRFSANINPVLQLSPAWWNAPPFFVKQSKPSAFCKLLVAQAKPLAPLTKPLSWSIVYSLITAADEDIPSSDFTLQAEDASTLQNMPLPGGSGSLTCRVYAYVGGHIGKLLQMVSNTVKSLEAVVGSSSGKTFLAIPASDISAIDQAETLFQNILQEFASPTWTQQWMDVTPVALAATQSAATDDPDALKLGAGHNTVVFIPALSNKTDHIHDQSDKVIRWTDNLSSYLGKSEYQFTLTAAGITMEEGGSNPFDAIPYVAARISVDAGS